MYVYMFIHNVSNIIIIKFGITEFVIEIKLKMIYIFNK